MGKACDCLLKVYRCTIAVSFSYSLVAYLCTFAVSSPFLTSLSNSPPLPHYLFHSRPGIIHVRSITSPCPVPLIQALNLTVCGTHSPSPPPHLIYLRISSTSSVSSIQGRVSSTLVLASDHVPLMSYRALHMGGRAGASHPCRATGRRGGGGAQGQANDARHVIHHPVYW